MSEETPSGKMVITYGTFDLFHIGHLNMLKQLKLLGDRLIVGVSTDEFNAVKGKRSIIPFRERIEIVRAISYVDKAIPESSWGQKRKDIKKYGINVFGIGTDWKGKFDDLRQYCEVVYLDRTTGISTTSLRNTLRVLDDDHVGDLKKALGLISEIVTRFD